MVWPSGGDLRSSLTATMVVAPGLFSTTTGTPISGDRRAAIARLSPSAVPPGGDGVTMRTGLPARGQTLAQAALGAAMSARKAAAQRRMSVEKCSRVSEPQRRLGERSRAGGDHPDKPLI